ncbi:DUF2235 domain-containing protein [Pseudoxanthomonas sp. LH2527]|uniref:phospholipase effector Tle1 domain-containing protein n=1 Tax=Pseudoxanthomonas sp. LH2527 TaxID=2923249 RepID=UPI001F12A14D|nr:DUF2235 domain-containing protein [Pseudoxanthomonas sp. LH2527]MCH6483131.1 DUF2235 domain-containing protein [Pseudoxanthomonas sp. LH2527]
MQSSEEAQDRDGRIEVERTGEAGRESYRQAEAELAKLRVPLFLREGNAHERLYIAGLDGTGNSLFDDDPAHWSAVAKIYKQIEEARPPRVAAGYVEGTFTQNGWLRTPEKLFDGRFGHTFDERVETAYFQFCVQAKEWLREDPAAQIRVAGIGFSRGGEQMAALERMIHERGIRDPESADYRVNGENLITRIEYADRPLLVQPGVTPQVALMIDPVQTGVEEHDRRLPPSTLTTFQLTAENERRDLFKATLHVSLGFSEDDRSLNLVRPGSHGDMADTYSRNGLGIENFNLSVEFLNRLSDTPYLEKRPLPEDPDQYVIHRSDQHMGGLYGTRGYDRDGVRDHVDTLAPERLCRQAVVDDCNRKAPIDEALDAQFERRTGASSQATGKAVGGYVEEAADRSVWPGLNDIVERVSRAGPTSGGDPMSAVLGEYLRGPWARQFQADVARELAAREEPSMHVASPQSSPAEPARESPAAAR